MTVSSTLRRAGPFAGDGTSTEYPFTFRVFDAGEVVATLAVDGVETVLSASTDYTVSVNDDQQSTPGGTVSLGFTLAAGQTLSLTSKLPYDQPLEITNAGGFYPKVIESFVMAELPFMATEEILMAGVQNGGDRQHLHEVIRKHSHAASAVVKMQGKPNDLIDRLGLRRSRTRTCGQSLDGAGEIVESRIKCGVRTWLAVNLL